MNASRKAVVGIALGAVASTVATSFMAVDPAVASSSVLTAMSVTFPIGGPQSPHPCPGDTCVVHGALLPFGGASGLFVGTADRNTWQLKLATSAGTVDFSVTLLDCCDTPGGSGVQPYWSYGHPIAQGAELTVVSGTGDFAQASGTIGGIGVVAGAAASFRGVGTLTFG